MLTPLVDVIFLLVIFFALSSRIAPFVLVPVSESAEADTSEADASEAKSPDNTAAAPTTLVLSRGHVRTGGRIISLDVLAAEAALWPRQEAEPVLLVTSRSALTEDVAQALTALRQARIGHVRLVARPPTDAAGEFRP
ncbi:ExbD/TolR family protein [Jiella endophytica]|nr:biopolymer transporter ExbD [Jiella endophytica]